MSDREARLKRLRLRAWRRGIKEMDLILGPFADAHLATLAPAELDAFETLLDENDQDLFAWATGRRPAPAYLDALLARATRHASDMFRQESRVL